MLTALLSISWLHTVRAADDKRFHETIPVPPPFALPAKPGDVHPPPTEEQIRASLALLDTWAPRVEAWLAQDPFDSRRVHLAGRFFMYAKHERRRCLEPDRPRPTNVEATPFVGAAKATNAKSMKQRREDFLKKHKHRK